MICSVSENKSILYSIFYFQIFNNIAFFIIIKVNLLKNNPFLFYSIGIIKKIIFINSNFDKVMASNINSILLCHCKSGPSRQSSLSFYDRFKASLDTVTEVLYTRYFSLF